MTELRTILVWPPSVERINVACALVGGISSVLLINATEFASIAVGPIIAACGAALYAGVLSPRRVRAVAISGATTLLGSVAVIICLLFVVGLMYAIFG